MLRCKSQNCNPCAARTTPFTYGLPEVHISQDSETLPELVAVAMDLGGAHSDLAEAEAVAGAVELAVFADGSEQHLLEAVLNSAEQQGVAEAVVR